MPPKSRCGSRPGSSLIQAPRRKSKARKRGSNQSGLHRLSDAQSVGSQPDKISESEVVEDITEEEMNKRQGQEEQVADQKQEQEQQQEDEKPQDEQPSAPRHPTLTPEQAAAARMRTQQDAFDEMDVNGDGAIDKDEMRDGLVELGVVGAEVDDVNRFFLTGRSSLSFDDFVGGDIFTELKKLRKEKAAEDIASYEELKAMSHRGTFVPDRVLRIIIEYCPIDSLRMVGCTSVTLRKWGCHNEYWKAALLKRRRLEQAMKITLFSLPEVKVTGSYYEWYVEWVREVSSENGAKLWVRRIKSELMNDGEVHEIAVAKPCTVVCVLNSVVVPLPAAPTTPLGADKVEETAQDVKKDTPKEGIEDNDVPPPPPPELPTVLVGDEIGTVNVHTITAPDTPTVQLQENDGVITAITYNNNFIYVGSADCTVTVWDRADLVRPVFNLIGHKEAISTLVVAEWDPKIVVSGSMDRTVVMWNKLEKAKAKKKSDAGFAQQVHAKHVLEGHTMKVTEVLVLKQCVLSASRDCLIIGWSWTGEQVIKMEGHMGPVNALKLLVSPHPKTEIEGPIDTRKQSSPPAEAGRDRKTSTVGQDDMLVSACGGGLVKGWNLKGKQVLTKKLHESPIETIEVCAVLRVVVTGSWDNTLCIMNLDTEIVLAQLKGHNGMVRSIILDPHRRRVITGSDDKSVGIWSFSSVSLESKSKVILSPHYLLTGAKAPITDMTLVKDHKEHWYSLFVGVKDKVLYHWCFLPDSHLQNTIIPVKRS